MNQKYTLHTHTIGFDGKNTAQDMINRARELGFDTIGISNHFIVHPNIKHSPMYPYSVRGGYDKMYASTFDEVMSRFVPHYRELRELRDKNPDMKILCGLEVDFFNNPEWRRGFEKSLTVLQPDYIIGSCHFIEWDNILLNSHDMKKADSETQEHLLRQYWTNVAQAATSGLFTWMAHLDLPKKVGLGREQKWAEYEHNAICAIARSGTVLEINTSGYKPECDEPYPSMRILEMARDNNVPVLLSDDAHNIANIGRHFDRGHEIIKTMGLSPINKIR